MRRGRGPPLTPLSGNVVAGRALDSDQKVALGGKLTPARAPFLGLSVAITEHRIENEDGLFSMTPHASYGIDVRCQEHAHRVYRRHS